MLIWFDWMSNPLRMQSRKWQQRCCLTALYNNQPLIQLIKLMLTDEIRHLNKLSGGAPCVKFDRHPLVWRFETDKRLEQRWTAHYKEWKTLNKQDIQNQKGRRQLTSLSLVQCHLVVTWRTLKWKYLQHHFMKSNTLSRKSIQTKIALGPRTKLSGTVFQLNTRNFKMFFQSKLVIPFSQASHVIIRSSLNEKQTYKKL